jgi:hypothetical protein
MATTTTHGALVVRHHGHHHWPRGLIPLPSPGAPMRHGPRLGLVWFRD